MSAAVSIYIYQPTPSGQSQLYRVTQLRTDGVHCRESVVSKQNHCCTAVVYTMDPFSPPDLCLYKRRKFSVHGTVSYVVFQNIPVVITAVLSVDSFCRVEDLGHGTRPPLSTGNAQRMCFLTYALAPTLQNNY